MIEKINNTSSIYWEGYRYAVGGFSIFKNFSDELKIAEKLRIDAKVSVYVGIAFQSYSICVKTEEDALLLLLAIQ